jgi:hypothetical protein
MYYWGAPLEKLYKEDFNGWVSPTR